MCIILHLINTHHTNRLINRKTQKSRAIYFLFIFVSIFLYDNLIAF
jgi:hypothetical protein